MGGGGLLLRGLRVTRSGSCVESRCVVTSVGTRPRPVVPSPGSSVERVVTTRGEGGKVKGVLGRAGSGPGPAPSPSSDLRW